MTVKVAEPAAGATGARGSEGEAPRFLNFIDGEWCESSTGEFYENRNPARMSDLIGLFPLSGDEDVQRAVASARQGFLEWRAVPAPERGEVLRHAGDLMAAGKEAIARLMTREMGKVLARDAGETCRRGSTRRTTLERGGTAALRPRRFPASCPTSRASRSGSPSASAA